MRKLRGEVAIKWYRHQSHGDLFKVVSATLSTLAAAALTGQRPVGFN
jgi:hypothetical protein